MKKITIAVLTALSSIPFAITASYADNSVTQLTSSSSNSFGESVSDNGIVALIHSIGPYGYAYIWTPTGGLVNLGTLGGIGPSSALGISADGSTVVPLVPQDTLAVV